MRVAEQIQEDGEAQWWQRFRAFCWGGVTVMVLDTIFRIFVWPLIKGWACFVC